MAAHRNGAASPRAERRSVFLFLQIAYAGGVWETTKELLRELVGLNRERGRLDLILGVHEDQEDIRALEGLGTDLRLQRLRLNAIQRSEVVRMMGTVPAWLAGRPEHEFCFFSGARGPLCRPTRGWRWWIASRCRCCRPGLMA